MRTDTLLLAHCFLRAEPPPAEDVRLSDKIFPSVVIGLDAEWREATTADLHKVAQTPAESRTKMLVWLRERSTSLAHLSGTARNGQRSAQAYLWEGSPTQSSPRPGVTLEWEPSFPADDKPPASIGPTSTVGEIAAMMDQQIRDRELKLRVRAAYFPLKNQALSPLTEFVFEGPIRPGVPELVAAKVPPQKDQPAVVLMLTAYYEIIR